MSVTAVCMTLALALVGPADLPPVAPADRPEVRHALAEADARAGEFIEEWIRIAQIPAPSGKEARRADYLERRFREMGLSSVGRDAAGNVMGRIPGRDASLPRVAFLAHMDTVAPLGADHTVDRSTKGRLRGPGVRDDSSGLAGLVAACDLMQRNGLRPPADTWFVATVEEEVGLKGADRFMADHAGELGAVIAVDGQLGQISWGATGITWLKLKFEAPGGHTLRAHETPSAVLAMARAIERIHAIPLRRSPEAMESWLNIGMVGGGDVPNAQAREAWFAVDLRSNDAGTLDALELKVTGESERTAREVGVGFTSETLQRQAAARPSAMERSPLALSAKAVLQYLGWKEIHMTARGTADHNMAVTRGIPGIAIGVTTGDGAHTPSEFADLAPFATGIRQLILLALMPLTAVRPGGE